MLRVVLSSLCLCLAASACSPRQPQAVSSSAPAAKPAPRKVPPPPTRALQWEVTVQAGDEDCDAQLITVALPRKPPVQAVQVRELNGDKVVAQMTTKDVLAFRIKPLKARAQAIYVVDEDQAPALPGKRGMQATQNDGGVKLTLNDRPVLSYVRQPKVGRQEVPAAVRGGYLHPLYSPAGVLVTDDSPKNKPFQRGIWTAWQKIESAGSHPDFWDLAQGKGRVGVESIGSVWGGPLAAGFDARQYFSDLDKRMGMTVLRESWEVVAHGGTDRYTLVDLRSTQEALNSAITLGANPFGGILVRGSRDWQGSKAVFLSSDGKDRDKARGATARWCYLGGGGGKRAGIAILSHPDNPQAPETLFIDPVDPLMGFAPTGKGPLALKARGTIRLKYRYVLLDGAPDSKLFDKLWTEFANPPKIQVRVTKSE